MSQQSPQSFQPSSTTSTSPASTTASTSSSSQPTVVQPRQPTEEEKRLVTIFADMENRQLDFLDEAGKSIIERIATFLAVLFAVTAFGNDFPPKYLVHISWSKYLVIGILLCYLLALGMGMWAIQPRKYSQYINNVSGLQEEWDRLVTRKRRWVKWAGILFALGTASLAVLIVSIVWPV